MKTRGMRKSGEKIEAQMAPMIDVVFQLLIFFMLTLKIIPPAGDFNINMPIGAPSQRTDTLQQPDIKIRMIADANGNLAELKVGNTSLGNGDDVFPQLNAMMKNLADNPNREKLEVEIDADHELHYEYTLKTVGAVTGRYDPQADEIVPYIQKVKFAPPRKEKG